MINELYELSRAMEQAGINAQSWYRKYKPLPNISAKAPCIHITIENGQVISLSEVPKEIGCNLRRFGDNRGFYPGMNLAPLYRITDDTVKKAISKVAPEQIDEQQIEKIKQWCTDNNWVKKCQTKYKNSMRERPTNIKTLLGTHNFQPLDVLISETSLFHEPLKLHRELEKCAFRMLSTKENIKTALSVLFYLGNDKKSATDDFGSLSVIFDTPKLFSQGISVVSARFTNELNNALLLADTTDCPDQSTSEIIDAFSTPFEPIEEPMPEVKLAGGFDVKLRTMFKEQHCQHRYGRIEDATYPLSPENRKRLQAALIWLGGSVEQKDITWTNTDKNEIMFVYPFSKLNTQTSYTRMFKRPANGNASFVAQSRQFISEIKQGRERGTDSHAKNIHVFILNKIDKGRTKVLYSRQTDPYELEYYSEEWTLGCSANLPMFPFGQPDVPFPLESADILNCFWKQDGTQVTDKFKPTPKYHGMELLLEPNTQIQADLHTLVQNGINIASFLGQKTANEEFSDPIFAKEKAQIALMGLFLYRTNIRKEKYMESYPYLYGQLLKASDELHLLYCKVVRNGDIPTQLAGGTLFQAATEAPVRALNTLGQRMNPYILWAKSYRYKEIHEAAKESWRAAWLLSMYEKIATQLSQVLSSETRLNDEEKAQLFLGYIAAFPKKENNEEVETEIEEEKSHE